MKISNSKILEAVNKAIKKVISEETNGFGSLGARAKALNNKTYFELLLADFCEEMEEDEIKKNFEEAVFHKIIPAGVIEAVNFNNNYGDEEEDFVVINGEKFYEDCFGNQSDQSFGFNEFRPGDVVFGELNHIGDNSLFVMHPEESFISISTCDWYPDLNSIGTKEKIAEGLADYLYNFLHLNNSPTIRTFIDKIERGEEF